MYYLFILFFISVIAFGSISIGPVSVRVIMSVLMIAMLLFNPNKSNWKMPRKYIIMYLLYLFFYGLSLIMNGEFESHGYIKQILAFHLICIIVYFACHSFIKTEELLRLTTKAMLGVLVVTSIATILQYYENPIGWSIAVLLNSSGLTETIQNNMEEGGGTFLGKSITVGIFPYVFTNAMFIASTSVVSLYGVLRNDVTIYVKVLYIGIAALAFIACFMTQQRAAFGLMLLGYAYVFFLLGGKKIAWIIIVLFSIFFLNDIGLDILLSDERLGRFGELLSFKEDESRNDLREIASTFLSDNLLWGGPQKYQLLAGYASHNFIYNAFIYGGLFGGICVISLSIMMIIRSIKVIIKYNEKKLSPFFAIGLLVFLGCGFFHNASLVIGSSQIFILFSLMLIAEHFEANLNNRDIKK